MNTVWIFGDSFSWDYNVRLNGDGVNYETDMGWDYIQRYLNGNIFDSWGKIISRELNMNYVNHASYTSGISIPGLPRGNSNNSAINLINELSSQFKKGDIVFFGFTDICRHDFVIDSDKQPTTVRPSNIDFGNDEEKNTANLMVFKRNQYDFYKIDELQKLKSIETLSNIVGFDLWYWDWSNTFDPLVLNKTIPSDRWIFFKAHSKYSNYRSMIIDDYKAGGINWETKNEIPDGHMGKVGNKIHSEVILNFFKKKLF